MYWARRPTGRLPGGDICQSGGRARRTGTEDFPTKEEQQAERQRLHELIERLVVWENVQPDSQDDVLERGAPRDRPFAGAGARRIRADGTLTQCWHICAEHAPPLHDPFAGGGSIPLEAQRLGLRVIASDLNPVAALINKSLVELPPKFKNQPPVNPETERMGMTIGKGRKVRRVAWRGAAGLATTSATTHAGCEMKPTSV